MSGPRPPIIPAGEVLPPLGDDAAPRGRPAGWPDAARPPRRRPGAAAGGGGRFAVLNRFVDETARGLARAEVLVWLVLYRDTRDGTARTSHADVARRCGVHRRTVVRAVQALVRRGLLVVVCRGGLNRGPSAYRVLAAAAGD